ncbi:MAG: S41 family peptidase [Gaiellaceae bacterium]
MRRGAGYLAALVFVVGTFALGFFLTQTEQGTSQPAPTRADRPVRLIDQVRAELASSYYRWIDPDVLERRTVEDILNGLEDPYTDVLSAAEYQSLRVDTEGTYSGIGLTVGPGRSGLVVTSAAAGPAREAGIRKDDVIVRVDEKPVRGLPFERALELIKGEAGTVVTVTIRRPARKKPLDFSIVRREIEVPPISTRLIAAKKEKLAYIRVFSFPAGTATRIDQATSQLVEQGVSGAIIDLRDNPGGLLSQAVDVASLYVEEGIVCRTDGLHAEDHEYRVTGVATHPGLPLVVLVNGGSASAAEIVAGALVDHDRATLVGERTYGKASVQTIAPLRGGGALKLTTAKYLTPAGADITGVGLQPSVVAADDPLTQQDEGLRIARRTLARILRAA